MLKIHGASLDKKSSNDENEDKSDTDEEAYFN
jgi:hypothetical protein